MLIDTSESIPNSELEIIDGMGHDFPVELIPKISERIIRHCLQIEFDK